MLHSRRRKLARSTEGAREYLTVYLRIATLSIALFSQLKLPHILKNRQLNGRRLKKSRKGYRLQGGKGDRYAPLADLALYLLADDNFEDKDGCVGAIFAMTTGYAVNVALTDDDKDIKKTMLPNDILYELPKKIKRNDCGFILDDIEALVPASSRRTGNENVNNGYFISLDYEDIVEDFDDCEDTCKATNPANKDAEKACKKVCKK